LIAARALLGLAGAALVPSTLSLVSTLFEDPAQRTRAIGVWGASFAAGASIGPLVGGILLEHFWWGSVFLISVPVMVLLLVLGPMLLPEYREPDAGRPDLVSAAMSIGAVLLVIYGLKRIAQDGLSITAIASILAGLGIGFAFVRRQLRLEDPLIDLRLFAIPAFRASLVLYGGTILILFGGFLFLPQYLQLVLGLSPLMAGLWTVPWGVAFIVGSIATPALARRVPPEILMSGGLVLAAVGYGILTRVGTTPSLTLFALATFIFALGTSPVFTLTNDVIIGSAPPERAGAASGISETCAELGGALGIAFFGSIGVALYRAGMSQVLPQNLSTEATAAAMSTLGGAVAIAGELPAAVSQPLLAAARDAFLRGLQVCATISVVGTIGLALFAAARFHRVDA